MIIILFKIENYNKTHGEIGSPINMTRLRKLNLMSLGIVILISAMFSLMMIVVAEGSKQEEEQQNSNNKEHEKKLGKIMDDVRTFSTSDKIEFCHYMKDVGYLKDSVQCLTYVNEPKFYDSVNTFIILKGYGLYDSRSSETENIEDEEDN
jgi:hypothetical protein